MRDMSGHRLPQVNFRVYQNLNWQLRTTDDFFRNKRVVVFALPGAFTPVCSSLHLPSYNDLYDTIRDNGIDDVYCLAVNDSFVLEAWKKAEKAYKITMIPDADGQFTRALGFLKKRNDMCLGERSWRYAMVVNNGVIEKMFIEPESGEGEDPYGQSSPETVLKYLNPAVKFPDDIVLFSKHTCPECQQIKDALILAGVPFEELILNEQFSLKTIKALSGLCALPQVYINGNPIKKEDILSRYSTRLHSGRSRSGKAS